MPGIILMDVGDVLDDGGEWETARPTWLSIIGVLAEEPVGPWQDRGRGVSDDYKSATEMLRNEAELPADPFYDADGNPDTDEMLMYAVQGGYLNSVGRIKYVAECGGTMADWVALSFAEKCKWIQEYVAPGP